jgi:hypothetical protein
VGTVVACGDVAGLRDSAALEKLGDEAVARRRGEDVGAVAVVCAAKTIWSRPRPPVPGGDWRRWRWNLELVVVVMASWGEEGVGAVRVVVHRNGNVFSSKSTCLKVYAIRVSRSKHL